jgi:RNA polymerase sigma factor (sigma-70 family)
MDRDEAVRKANEYRERLIAHVNSFMGSGMRRRFDAEDVVQSALKSFFKQEALPNTEDGLTNLLYHFTEYKRRKRFRDALAGKRDFRREEGPPGGAARHEWDALFPDDRLSGPEEAAIQNELTRLVDGWWEDLDPELRAVLELRAEGRTQAEIAGQLGVSDRTVRRYLEEAEDSLRTLLGLENPSGDVGGGSSGE